MDESLISIRKADQTLSRALGSANAEPQILAHLMQAFAALRAPIDSRAPEAYLFSVNV